MTQYPIYRIVKVIDTLSNDPLITVKGWRYVS